MSLPTTSAVALSENQSHLDYTRQDANEEATTDSIEIDQVSEAAPDGGYGWIVLIACFVHTFLVQRVDLILGNPTSRSPRHNIERIQLKHRLIHRLSRSRISGRTRHRRNPNCSQNRRSLDESHWYPSVWHRPHHQRIRRPQCRRYVRCLWTYQNPKCARIRSKYLWYPTIAVASPTPKLTIVKDWRSRFVDLVSAFFGRTKLDSWTQLNTCRFTKIKHPLDLSNIHFGRSYHSVVFVYGGRTDESAKKYEDNGYKES
ncbi:hypothetical protein DL98DRAFT_611511 [Cadophora sp. DSE1049]|nr:hypothetical protein DL98DRAFT_611511 [Cadophora sp. DSE1049]